MTTISDERYFAELRDCTAGLARITGGDLDTPVPTCPGWTFRQLATHLGRGHRWAARIVATRATAPVPTREVPDGKLPADPAEHGPGDLVGITQRQSSRSAAFRLVAELPLGATGKVARKRLRELAAAYRSPEPGAAA